MHIPIFKSSDCFSFIENLRHSVHSLILISDMFCSFCVLFAASVMAVPSQQTKHLMKKNTANDLSLLFTHLDEDGDGEININELWKHSNVYKASPLIYNACLSPKHSYTRVTQGPRPRGNLVEIFWTKFSRT